MRPRPFAFPPRAVSLRALGGGLATLVLLAATPARGQTPTVAERLEDFEALKRELTSHYANLEWAVTGRRIDLRKLSDRISDGLREAETDAEARAAIEAFLASFGDGHLAVEWPDRTTAAGELGDAPRAPDASPCAARGFFPRPHDPGVAFHRLAEFRAVTTEDSKFFPIGRLRVRSGHHLGVLRIATFSEYDFPELCESLAARDGRGEGRSRDETEERRLAIAAADRLTEALARQIRTLRRSGIDGLLVDITGNGGGTTWLEPAMRSLTRVRVRGARLGFLRHPHWTKQLRARLATLEGAPAPPDAGGRARRIRAAAALRRAVEASESTCDRASLWENRAPGCSAIAEWPLFTTGVEPYARPGSLGDGPEAEILFSPSRYRYTEGVYDGPLYLLVDSGTASSAERFAAALGDQGAAVLVGQPTRGAGCGYTDGGIPTRLPHSRAVVKIPDCVQLRADGSNAVAGITPDVLVPWRDNDSQYLRAVRAAEAIRRAVGRGRAHRTAARRHRPADPSRPEPPRPARSSAHGVRPSSSRR